MHLRMTCAITAAVSAMAVGSAQADPRAPFAQATAPNGNTALAGWVETELQGMVTSCLGGSGPLRLTRWGNTVVRPSTVIPANLRTALGLSTTHRWVRLQEAQGVSRLFETVYTGPSGETPTTPPSRLVVDPGGNRAATPLAGVDLVAYRNDCNTSLSAALRADTNFTLPVASLRAALDARYNATDDYELTLVAGEFTSPLYSSLYPLAGGRTDVQPFNAALAVWLWYREQPGRVGGTHWLLAGFNGYALVKQQTSTRAAAVSTEVAGSAGVTGISGTADIQAATTRSTDLTATLYAVAFQTDASGRPRRRFEPLITLERAAELTSAHSRPVRDTTLSDSLELLDAQPVRFRHTIAGLPQTECATTFWSVDNPEVVLEDVDFDAASQGCAFVTRYSPSPAAISNGERLRFRFMRQFGDTPSGQDLAFQTAIIPLTGGRAPALTWQSGPREPSRIEALDGAGRTTTRWTKSYQLTDLPLAARSVTSIRLDDVVIKCESGRVMNADPTVVINAGAAAGRTVTLTIETSLPFPVEAAAGAELCNLDGGLLEYQLQNGERVYKPLPANNADIYVPYPPISVALVAAP